MSICATLRPTLMSCFVALLLLSVGHWLYLRNMAEPEIALTTSGAVGDRKPRKFSFWSLLHFIINILSPSLSFYDLRPYGSLSFSVRMVLSL